MMPAAPEPVPTDRQREMLVQIAESVAAEALEWRCGKNVVEELRSLLADRRVRDDDIRVIGQRGRIAGYLARRMLEA